MFGIGTALVYLSNIRRKHGKTFKRFRPFAPVVDIILPPEPVQPKLPLPILPSTASVKCYDVVDDITEVTKELPEAIEPKVKLDAGFNSAMKHLGFTKAEVQCIVSDITAQNFEGQVKQALKLLKKPTLKSTVG